MRILLRLPNNMKILLISFVIILHTWLAQGQNKFATCQRAWTKIGCFKDNIKPSRPLPEMLLNDRDRYSKYHEKGYRLNWHKWTESIHSLACRCAQKALQKGYNVFGLQFYGECWSGPFAEFNYSRDGRSDNCIMNLQQPTTCVQAEDQECVGQKKTNYIYKLTANPGPQSPDVDGGYTQWSDWTVCSKTCGGGSKSRERTCTNPKPQGNGQPCYPRLGEAEENAKCNEKKCDDCDKVMDVGIVVDSSSSVRRDNFEKVKQFLVNLVGKLHVSHSNAHVGVIHYNHRPFLDWDFKADVAQNPIKLKAGILALRYRPGGTRTDRAMDLADEAIFRVAHGERLNVPHIMLVVTDGKTNPGSKAYQDVVKPFEDKGVKIVAVGVGFSVDNNELKQIAIGHQDKVVHVDNFDQLLPMIHQILVKFCQQRKPPAQVDVDDLFTHY